MGNQPLTGGYGCVDISSPFGYAIRKFTRSEYDHAFMILDASDGTILEAQPKGARISNISEYSGMPMVFSDDQCSLLPSVLKAAAQHYVGIPYGFLDIMYLGLEITTRDHRPDGPVDDWLLKRVCDTRRMICSQLVAQFGKQFSTDWTCGAPDPQLVTPGMLAAR
jgi:hypothetical protein